IPPGCRRAPGATEADMTTRRIDRGEWKEFLEGFSRQHEGWLATVEVLDGAEEGRVEGRELPLAGIATEPPGKGDEITIDLSADGASHLTHVVRSPARVALLTTEAGADVGLEI